MSFQLNEIVEFAKVYHLLESEARDFLFISSSSMKDKSHKERSAQRTLKAIEEYKKLPMDVRKEFERDSSSSVSKILELENLCLDCIKKI